MKRHRASRCSTHHAHLAHFCHLTLKLLSSSAALFSINKCKIATCFFSYLCPVNTLGFKVKVEMSIRSGAIDNGVVPPSLIKLIKYLKVK